MSASEFHLQPSDVKAIAIALDELTSYLGATEGYDAADDAKLRWTEQTLKKLLDTYARYEQLKAMESRHFRVVQAAPIRFSYKATPPSGPGPGSSDTSETPGKATGGATASRSQSVEEGTT